MLVAVSYIACAVAHMRKRNMLRFYYLLEHFRKNFQVRVTR